MILLIPTAVLLAISFFVLVTVTKVQEKSLKIFGWVISVFLWIVAALIFATAVATTSACDYGKCGFSKSGYKGICQLKGGRDQRMNPHQGMMMNRMDDMSMEDMPMGGMMGSMSGKDMNCLIPEDKETPEKK